MMSARHDLIIVIPYQALLLLIELETPSSPPLLPLAGEGRVELKITIF